MGIYLRLRDKYRDTILLESTDNHAAENSYSFICVNAIAGIEISSAQRLESKLPGQKPEQLEISDSKKVPSLVWEFMQRFESTGDEKEARFAQGLYGYTTYDAIRFFETISLKDKPESDLADQFSFNQNPVDIIPLMRYRLYQYVIVINHFKDELFLCENKIEGIPSDPDLLESLIRSKDVPVYPFAVSGEETSNMNDADYREYGGKRDQSLPSR